MVAAISSAKSFNFKQIYKSNTDAHWVIQNSDRHTLGSYSLWWKNTPELNSQRVGYLGDVLVDNQEHFSALLRHSCQELKHKGCDMAIAPIDGNTWQRYRTITETDNSNPFFLESPYQGFASGVFKAQGFQTIATYHSRRVSDLQSTDRRSPRIEARLSRLGIKIREIELHQLEQELAKMYPVVHQSFQSHFLYSPISKEAFIKQYFQLKEYIDPRLILIAEHNNQIVGFMFAIPDFLEINQKTIVFKTLGVLPQLKYAGLGILLLDKIRQISFQMGFREAIYALIQTGGLCENMTRNHGNIFRRYALFGKAL